MIASMKTTETDITEGFQPSQNIIVKPWVYMGFNHSAVLSCITFNVK